MEAIKSGKRFKREGWDKFHSKSEYTIIDFDILLADDWEIESEPGTITREQFDAAWSKLWPYDAYNDSLNSINCYTKLERDALAKELGL
jgi:hypothetical protein